jgi:hypothetical protein
VSYPKIEFQKSKQLTERKREIFENKFETVRKFWAGNVAILPTLIYVFGNMSIRFAVSISHHRYICECGTGSSTSQLRKQYFTATDIEG